MNASAEPMFNYVTGQPMPLGTFNFGEQKLSVQTQGSPGLKMKGLKAKLRQAEARERSSMRDLRQALKTHQLDMKDITELKSQIQELETTQ
jgi:hypothetical protein